MIQALLALAAAALLWNAHRMASRLEEAALEGARRRLAIGVLALAGLCFLVPARAAAPFRVPLVVVAVLVAFASWEAMARLIAVGARRPHVIARAAFFGLAVLTLFGRVNFTVPGFFVGLGASSYRWKDRLPTRRLLTIGLVALALSFLAFSPSGRLGPGAPGWARTLWAFANAIRVGLAIHAMNGGVSLIAAFFRDPSLGVRTVGRRLALSHALVVVVPLFLMGLLWEATTVLGVNRDRARVGARAIESQATRLEAQLRAALAAEGDPRSRVVATALGWNVAGPRSARAFLREGGRLEQVAGDSLTRADAVAAWLDTLGVVPARGSIVLEDQAWIAAAADTMGRAAVLMVPADTLVRREVSAVAGAQAWLIVPSEDSLDARGARVTSSGRSGGLRRGGRTTMNLANRRYDLTAGDLTGEEFLFTGHAFIPAREWRRNAWRYTQLLLTVRVPTGEALTGLFNNSSSDPIGYVPAMMILAFGVLLVLATLMDVFVVTSMGRWVASAIGALHGAAKKLEGGDLAQRIDVQGDDDLWDVAKAMNQASAGLERAREADQIRQRMEGELAVARRIQARLLPAGPPRVPGLDVFGASEAAREVGGDYFDHIDLGAGRIALVIADVSGKGVPAALLMSAFRASLMSRDLASEAPDRLAERLNDFLHRSVDPGKFVTAFVAFLDAASGELHYVNAGHNPPLVLREQGAVDWLTEGGTILGILPGSVFASGRAVLAPGDLLVLYTDGVTEGATASGEQWGEERLVEAVKRLRGGACEAIARSLVREVREFEGDTGPADDLTVIVARRA